MSTVTSSSASSAATASVTADKTALQQAMQSVISGATSSSMDVNSLVTALVLVNTKTAGQVATLANQQSLDTTQISAYGALSAALSRLQAAFGTLSNGTLKSTFTATMTGGTDITAKATTGAVAGSYGVTVSQIAQSQAISSSKFDANQNLGSGTLAVHYFWHQQAFNVTIGDSNSRSATATIRCRASLQPSITRPATRA